MRCEEDESQQQWLTWPLKTLEALWRDKRGFSLKSLEKNLLHCLHEQLLYIVKYNGVPKSETIFPSSTPENKVWNKESYNAK